MEEALLGVAMVAVALGSSLKDPTEARTLLPKSIASEPSGLILLEDVFLATLLTRQSGAEVQMEHGHCATPADFVSFTFVCFLNSFRLCTISFSG